jgi:small subunit ribosomal protein S16
MLAISLMRMGAKKKPFYRVVVKEKRSKRDGKYLENLGTYDPMQDPAEVRLVHDRIQYWIGVGAQPTETVASLIKNNPEMTEEEKADRAQAIAAKKEAAAQARAEAMRAETEAAEKAAAEKAEADAKAAAEAKAAEDAAAAEAAAEAAAVEDAPADEAPAEAAAEDAPAGESAEEAPAEEAAEPAAEEAPAEEKAAE